MRYSSRITAFFIFLFVFIASFPSFSVIIADIDTVDFPVRPRRSDIKLADGKEDPTSKEDKRDHIPLSKHIRVIFFDIEDQSIVDNKEKFPGTVYYLSIADLKDITPHHHTFVDWFNITYFVGEKGLLTYTLDLSPCKITKASKIIRTGGAISNPGKLEPANLMALGVQDDTRPNLQFVYTLLLKEDSFPSQRYMDVDTLQNFLSKNYKRSKTRNVGLKSIHQFYDPQDSVLKICTLKVTDFLSSERRNIGELFADVTMQFCGFLKKNGKYNDTRDNGFDGVFTKKEFIVLSDSKFFKDAPSIEDVMKKDIYATITKRLTNIEKLGTPQQKETGALITASFQTSPQSIYLLPYIVIDDGKVKSSLKSHIEVHEEANPSKPKPLPIVEEIDLEDNKELEQKTTNLYKESGIDDPIAFLQFVMKSLDIKDHALVKLKKK